MGLQLGIVNPTIFHDGMTRRVAENISRPNQVFLIARDEESSEIVNYAQRELPNDAQQDHTELTKLTGNAV